MSYRALVPVALFALVVSAWLALPGSAQEDDLPATVAALETRVAEMESRISALETQGAEPGADAEATEASEVDAGETPVASGGDGSSLSSPLALGEVGRVGDYEIRVIEVNRDAEDEVLAENEFNDGALPGKVMVIATLELTYDGTETGNPSSDFNFSVVGDAGLAYTTFDEDSRCGVIPDDMFGAPEMFPGAVTTANVCWQAPEEEVRSLVMIAEPLFSFDDDERLFFGLVEADADSVKPTVDVTQDAESAEITLTMVDLAFEPKTVTIPADTEVTFTLRNNGVLPHNFSVPDADVSVNVKAGERGTAVVTLPAGEYRFVCGIPGHTEAGMTGTLIVE